MRKKVCHKTFKTFFFVVKLTVGNMPTGSAAATAAAFHPFRGLRHSMARGSRPTVKVRDVESPTERGADGPALDSFASVSHQEKEEETLDEVEEYAKRIPIRENPCDSWLKK